MKSKILSGILLLFFFSSTLFASAMTLHSRNMPTHCEFVFDVESDIKISLPGNIQDESLSYQFQNSWDPYNWTNEIHGDLKINGEIKEIDITLQSMSLPKKFLYRHIRFNLPVSKITCIAEFGREFGEACVSEGRSGTPWKQRTLKCESLE